MRLKVEKILQTHGHCFHLEKIFCAHKYPPLEMLRLNRLKVSSSTRVSIEIILWCGCYGSQLSVNYHCGLYIRIALFLSEILSEYS